MGTEQRRGVTDRSEGSDGREGTHRIARALTDGGLDTEFCPTVVDRVGVGVGVYDASGRFAYVNPAYAEMLDRDVEDLLGTPVWRVNPALDAERFEAYWESFEVGQTREHRGRHRTPDGKTIHVETVTTAVDVGGTVYHVGTTNDITARVQNRQAADRQDERLEEFASVVSHDLRNPLNVAMGRIELVATECDSEHVGPVERSLARMEALIEDVLTLAREGSRLTDPAIVSVEEAVRTAWYTTDGTDATLSVTGDLGAVESEESRLCQIFESLFANAITHVGPAVTVRVGRLEDGFFVEDDGPGVPEDEREAVFDYGYSEHQAGTGFGLTIVREIAQAHDWSVDLTEGADGGARFNFHGVEFVEAEERA